MLTENHRPITATRFMHLITTFSSLREVLLTFGRYLNRLEDTNDPFVPNDLDSYVEFRACIIRQALWCGRYLKGISLSLEECQEWETFPDIFWDCDITLPSTSAPEISAVPFEDKFPSVKKYVIQEIERAENLTAEIMADYAYSGYIDHQPVAIDFFDYLIDIRQELYDSAQLLREIVG
jgi:hypothetical protein